jgi:hypothetical protein
MVDLAALNAVGQRNDWMLQGYPSDVKSLVWPPSKTLSVPELRGVYDKWTDAHPDSIESLWMGWDHTH